MASVNKVILVGNLGRDPEIRSTQDGMRIASLSVATSESWRDKASGERKERTEWHRVVIFNDRLVEIVEKYLRKGAKVYLEGALQTNLDVDRPCVDLRRCLFENLQQGLRQERLLQKRGVFELFRQNRTVMPRQKHQRNTPPLEKIGEAENQLAFQSDVQYGHVHALALDQCDRLIKAGRRADHDISGLSENLFDEARDKIFVLDDKGALITARIHASPSDGRTPTVDLACFAIRAFGQRLIVRDQRQIVQVVSRMANLKFPRTESIAVVRIQHRFHRRVGLWNDSWKEFGRTLSSTLGNNSGGTSGCAIVPVGSTPLSRAPARPATRQ